MKFITRVISKFHVNHEIRNARSKFTKAAVLKTINEPLVIEEFKITDNLKQGQVNKVKLGNFFNINLFLIILLYIYYNF